MSLEFDAKMSVNDMYTFNMYHSYRTSMGRLTLFIPVVVYAIAGYQIYRDGISELTRFLPYMLIVTALLFLNPIMLYFQSKTQVDNSDVLSDYLHYRLDEEGVHVSSAHAEEAALLPWDNVMDVRQHKNVVLIFSSRINAYIIPTDQIPDFATFKAVCGENLVSHRLHFKK